VVRAEKSSGTDGGERWDVLALGVGIGTNQDGYTLERVTRKGRDKGNATG
jgi:hypothetical protein